jgi:hypothetical protein
MKHKVFFKKRIGELEVFAVEKHRLCFDIALILSVVFGIFFQQNMGLHCNLDSCF